MNRLKNRFCNNHEILRITLSILRLINAGHWRIIQTMNEELDRLEIKISYLEAQNAELNEVVVSQARDMALLEKKIELLEKKLEDLIEESGSDRPSRKPPHY